jgi:hypothetical protein
MVPTITNPSFGEELYLPWQRRGAAIARKRLLSKETFRSGRPPIRQHLPRTAEMLMRARPSCGEL